MTRSVLDLSDQEVYSKFQQVVDVCRQIKAKRAFATSYIVTQKDGVIEFEALPPIPPEFDIGANLRKLVGRFHELRFYLSQQVEIEAQAWNTSSIGTMLKTIDDELREQLNIISEARKNNRPSKHDALLITLHAGAIADLASCIVKVDFLNKNSDKKFSFLNEKAREFFKKYKKQKHILTISLFGEMILAFDELIAQRGFERYVAVMRAYVAMHDTFQEFLDRQ